MATSSFYLAFALGPSTLKDAYTPEIDLPGTSNSSDHDVDQSPYTESSSFIDFSRHIGRVLLVLGVLTSIFICYTVSLAVYNLYFHPCRKFPGPLLWRCFHLPRHIAEVQGILDHQILAFHEKYGPVVRIGPDALTFSTSAAWKDIHGYGMNELPKDIDVQRSIMQDLKVPGIIQADNTAHARMRRQIAPAFSGRALREQQPIVNGYIDSLITMLHSAAATGNPIDLQEHIMYTTIDTVSDLTFGFAFNTLFSPTFRRWIDMQAVVGPQIALLRLMRKYPITAPFVVWSFDRELLTFMRWNRDFTWDAVLKRLHSGVQSEKRDFFSYILAHQEEGIDPAVSDGEMLETARFLVLAGSHTVRTVLSTTIFQLLRNPSDLDIVTKEVRDGFERQEDINQVEVMQKCPYMTACIDEAMRIHPPALSTLHARRTWPTTSMNIAGFEVPADTSVTAHCLALHLSISNFHDSRSFRPERWLRSSGNIRDAKGTSSVFANDDHAAYQPFFTGPRNCAGQNLAWAQMRLILGRLLWSFDIELCDDSADWMNQKCTLVWEDKRLMVRLRERKM